MSPLEQIIYLVIKPPKWLIIGGVALFFLAIVFGVDFFRWFKPLADFYIEKVMKILSAIIFAVIPK